MNFEHKISEMISCRIDRIYRYRFFFENQISFPRDTLNLPKRRILSTSVEISLMNKGEIEIKEKANYYVLYPVYALEVFLLLFQVSTPPLC